MNVPRDLEPEVRNASARLGVKPTAWLRAAITKQLYLVREDEAAAFEDTALEENWKRRRDAKRAKELLGH